MCGIAGNISFNNTVSNKAMVEAMCSNLKHRGPDNQEVLEHGEACLGHRRLAIIDLDSASNQPFVSKCGNFSIVFNGEIYNYLELAEKYKMDCKTKSDTEVLLLGLISNGKDFINELNGFFSFLFWDNSRRKGILVRDRLGIKPLYYYHNDQELTFCSELLPFKNHKIKFSLDKRALTDYFKFNYVPAPSTILKGVKKMMPGQLLEIDENGIKLEKYYFIKGKKSEPKDFQNLLEDSVSLRLRADVPLGCFLSGGVDSSVISLLAKRSKADLKTYSIGFPQSKYFDESPFAEEVAKKIGSDHQTIKLSDDKIIDQIDDVLSAYDEPFADSSSIAAYFLAQETAKSVKVVLSGDGADEMLGGYNKHEAFLRSITPNFKNTIAKSSSVIFKKNAGSRSGKWANKLRQLRKYADLLKETNLNRYDYLAAFQNEEFLKDILLQNETPTKVDLENADLKSFLLADLNFVLPNDMLKKMDFASMRHSLELRTPFLDHRLVESSQGLNQKNWIHGGRRKKVLYDLYYKELPSNVWNRPKHGFEVPLSRILDELKLKYAEFLETGFILDQGLFRPETIIQLSRDYSGNNVYSLWAYFVFQKWYKNFFKA